MTIPFPNEKNKAIENFFLSISEMENIPTQDFFA